MAALVLSLASVAGYAAHRSGLISRVAHLTSSKSEPPIARVMPSALPIEPARDREALSGLDLLHVQVNDDGVLAPTSNGLGR